jgi:putative serine protease PepD
VTDPSSVGNGSNEPRPGSDEPRPVEPRPVEPQPTEPYAVEPRSAEPRPTEGFASPAGTVPLPAGPVAGQQQPPWASPGPYRGPGNAGPGPAPSPFWSTQGARDPWRDPASAPAWLAPAPTPAPGAPPPPIDVAQSWPRRGGLAPVMLVAIVVALVAGLVGGALGYVVADRTDGSSFSLGDSSSGTAPLAERPPMSVAGIVRRVQPSVVTVVIRSSQGNGNGSGFVISPEGYILTNNHVAAPAAAGGTLRVAFSDGSSAPATIVGRDPGSDVAVLKIQKADLKPVTFGDSDKIAIGDPTIAFGSPLGLADTVTSGIVSAIDRPVRTGPEGGGNADNAYLAAIQTDAAINPGNSGGPLVDGAGRVIGINSAIAALPSQGSSTGGNIGIGFAIPINQAKRLAEEIIATKRARTTVIGAMVNLTDDTSAGARLNTVTANGPAAGAGLKPGDVITRFANRPIEDGVALIALIRKQAPGSKVGITYTRAGKTSTTTVTLGEK